MCLSCGAVAGEEHVQGLVLSNDAAEDRIEYPGVRPGLRGADESAPSSDHCGAAVDNQLLAVDVARVVRGEEQRDRRDLLGAAHLFAAESRTQTAPPPAWLPLHASIGPVRAF